MKDVINTAVIDALIELGIEPIDFTVKHPADVGHGDYACNVAMVVAKEVGKAPHEFAEQIRAVLTDKIEYVDKIEVAGPGFLNFYLPRDFFTTEIIRAVTLGDKWGHNHSWADKKVIVEYTDANPFKEFHIGHLFTNIV
ncbi:arginine--tRNA ligase, partial [Candidatus Kaiserbacteria bacterium]|nr:arginine--tRNA ligase [Candidatus Kaiserbacteria bacterium]